MTTETVQKAPAKGNGQAKPVEAVPDTANSLDYRDRR